MKNRKFIIIVNLALLFVMTEVLIVLSSIKFSFIDFSWWPLFIPFTIGLINWKYFNKPVKILYLCISYWMLNECVVFAYRHSFEIKNTMPFSNVYILISFLFLGLFYYYILKKFVKGKIMLLLIFGFEVMCLVNLVFFQSIFKYPVITNSISNILIVLFSVIYFYKLMIEANIIKLKNEPLVWINMGILIYYSGSLFYSGLFNLILDYSREFSKLTVVYFSTLNALSYILIAIGFWKTKKINPS